MDFSEPERPRAGQFHQDPSTFRLSRWSNGHQYYWFFELAMRYLIDVKGYGKSFQDVVSLFYDLRQGISFLVSFENHFEINVGKYEDEFYDRMRTYLSNGYR